MAATSDLRLTIEHDSEPIAGSLHLPDGSTLRFEGYLQLVSIFENLRDPHQAADDVIDREQ